MQNKQNLQETITTPEATPTPTPEAEMLGGLSVRTNLCAGISIEEIQSQVSSWWQNLSSSLSLPSAESLE